MCSSRGMYEFAWESAWMQSQQDFWCCKVHECLVFYIRFHISWSRSQKLQCHPKWNWWVWTLLTLLPPQFSLFVLRSRMRLKFIWYICVGMTTGIRFQNTDKKSYSVYSASFPVPLPWYWDVLGFEANNKSRSTASEVKFMRHKKCILEDLKRNQDNLDVLRLNKHD
jgi:hypothetical protein